MGFKQFNEMYDPFTPNGFEKYYEDLDEIRYQRVFKDRIQRIQLLKPERIKYYGMSNTLFLKIKPNESVGDWWNKQYEYKNEKELYERYNELNKYLLSIFEEWEKSFDKNQVNASVNKLIFDDFKNINKKVILENKCEIICIKDVRNLINNLLAKYQCIDEFNRFITECTSVYMSYVVEKYNCNLEFDNNGRIILSLIRDNENCKYIDSSWVVSGFWYFGDDDYLERGASGGRIWMGKPVKNPKWKEQNPDYIIE